MVAHDKKRAVAESLRASGRQIDEIMEGIETHACRAYFTLIGIICDQNLGIKKGLFESLADLIEPAPKYSEDTPKCERAALLALADDMDKFARDGGDGFEPVLSRAGCVEYARRIREACGVES